MSDNLKQVIINFTYTFSLMTFASEHEELPVALGAFYPLGNLAMCPKHGLFFKLTGNIIVNQPLTPVLKYGDTRRLFFPRAYFLEACRGRNLNKRFDELDK